MPDLISRHWGIESHPPSRWTGLHPLGCSYPKARLVSDHLNEAKPLEWCQTRWPPLVRRARQRQALRRCGAEARCAQWGARRSPWAPRGQQPAVPTSGKRRASKGFGLIASCAGRLFYKGPAGHFNSASYAAFLLDVLSQTRRHVGGLQDGARDHTRKAMQQLFDAHADRLPREQLPAYAPDFNPLEHLWKKGKQAATPLKYCPEFPDLPAAVERALRHFAQTPGEITVFMARYGESLGAMAA
jgi:transposase